MTLSDIASIGSLVSALAVLASLAYLSRQIRQAERSHQASIRSARATRTMDLQMATTEPSVAEAILKGLRGAPDMTEVQVFQFQNYALARFFNAEDAFFQHREGALNDFYLEVQGLKLSLASPGMRVFWRRHSGMFAHDFRALADRVLTETTVSSDAYGGARFKADAAAELPGPAPAPETSA
jgi:hypothetical protein